MFSFPSFVVLYAILPSLVLIILTIVLFAHYHALDYVIYHLVRDDLLFPDVLSTHRADLKCCSSQNKVYLLTNETFCETLIAESMPAYRYSTSDYIVKAYRTVDILQILICSKHHCNSYGIAKYL
jgi:hypothetical protein